MSIIEIKNVYFKRINKIILEDISITIKKNQITTIMGPSGCGKTTLLKLINKQLVPNSGSIKINGTCLNKLNKYEINNIRKNMGLLFQNGALFTDLNVYENIAFSIKEHTNLSHDIIEDLVLMKLESVGLKHAKLLMPDQLSLGMVKRIALARTIALDPGIIMYDEPFSGQDPISINVLIKLILLLNKLSKITTIIVSHNIHETLAISDYIYIINNNKIIAEGTSNDIKKNKNHFVKKFIKINNK